MGHGDIYRQYRAAVELGARSADAAGGGGTNEHGDVEAGIRGLQRPPRGSTCVWEMPEG